MTRPTARDLQRAARLGLILVGLLLGVHAYHALILHGLPLHADEAGHALPAARMALALRRGSPGEFLSASLREWVWPFLHPWVLTAFFLVLGISARVARACSLVTFGAALCLLPPLARRVAPPDPASGGSPPFLGWLSVALLLAAAPWGLVCTVMSEPLGMLLTLLTLVVAAEATRRDTAGWPALAGSVAALAFFTKYSYGLPLIAALVITFAWRAPRAGLRPLLATVAGASAPVLAWGLAILWSDPHRAADIFGALVNRDEGLHGMEGFLFYARVVSRSLGWPTGLVVLLLLARTTFRNPTAGRLPALLFTAVALALLMAHPNKQERYLFPVLPVMVVLAETETARLLGQRRRFGLLWPALAAAILIARNPLARLDDEAAGASGLRGAGSIVAYVADHVTPREPVLFLGTTGLLPHLALTWELLEREQREPEVDLLPFPGDSGWDPRFRAGYPPGGSPEYDRLLQQVLATKKYGSLVTLRCGEGSPFRPAWLAKWDAWGQNYVLAADRVAANAGYVLRSERAFSADQARVRIFTPRRPGPTDLRGPVGDVPRDPVAVGKHRGFGGLSQHPFRGA